MKLDPAWNPNPHRPLISGPDAQEQMRKKQIASEWVECTCRDVTLSRLADAVMEFRTKVCTA